MELADEYRFYTSTKKLVIELLASIALGVLCSGLSFFTDNRYLLMFCFVGGMVAVLGVLSSLFELYHVGTPAIFCTSEGIRIHLVQHPGGEKGGMHMGSVKEFISWKHVLDVSLGDIRFPWSKKHSRLLRLEYEKDMQLHKLEIHLRSLAANPYFLYEVIHAFQQKYGPQIGLDNILR